MKLFQDCHKSKACHNNRCKDPCPGVCAVNAECRVQNHAPICLCMPGYTGDPSVSCDFEIGKFSFQDLDLVILDLL